jgi:hypothetical protein
MAVIELAFIFGTLVLFTGCGLGIIAPYARKLPFALLASPQAGLLLLSTTTQLYYSIFYLPIGKALLLAIPTCLAVTVCGLLVTKFRLLQKELLFFLVSAALLSAVYTVASCASSIKNGSPSILYTDGTDHLAYAHLADWMRNHAPSRDAPFRSEPWADPTLPYQSLPNIVFGMDPRMGSYTFVGIIGVLRGVPSTFIYDSACAIALVAAILGVAAVFSTRLPIFLMLALGLSLAHWYDFTHAGFLSKALAYPSALLTTGLFFLGLGDKRIWTIVSLLSAVAGSALMLSGQVTVLILVLLGVPAMFLRTLQARRIEIRDFCVLILMSFFAIAVSGFFVRPYGGGFPHDPYRTLPTAMRALDIEGWVVATGTAEASVWLLVCAVAATITLVILAQLRQHAIATALLSAPMVFLVVLLACRSRDVAYQLTGFFYPATLCGAAAFASSSKPNSRRLAGIAGIAAMSVIMATRAPRAWIAAQHYIAPSMLTQNSISLDEFDSIEHVVNGRSLLVDLGPNPRLPIAALVELGRRGLQLQWTPRSWYPTVGGWRRSWTIPRYAAPAELRLVARAEATALNPLVSTRNFFVVKNQQQ